MPVVADIDAEPAIGGLEHRIAEIARLEEEFLIEARDLRDVDLAELAEIAAVGVDHRRRVVVDAGHRLLVDRHDDDHGVLAGEVLHQPGGRAVRNRLGRAVPFRILAWAEIGLGEDLLEAQHLDALLGRLGDERQVRLDHQVADLRRRHAAIALEAHLDEPGLDHRHRPPPSPSPAWPPATGWHAGSDQDKGEPPRL